MKDEETKRSAEEDFFSEKSDGSVPAPALSKPKKSKWVAALLVFCIVAVSFFGGFFARWYTLDSEMRTLVKVKGKIDSDYYKEVDDETFYSAIFAAINEEVLDNYSYYMTAEEYQASLQNMEGNRSGIGLVFRKDTESGVTAMTVDRVCGNSPAEAAGIKAGDKVVGFGVTEDTVTRSDSFEEFSAFLSSQDEKVPLCLLLLSGGEEKTVTVEKASYVENYVFYRTKDSAYGFGGRSATALKETGEPLTALDNDTAYIRLIQFTGNAEDAFDVAMEQFKKDGKKNLVLDLRGNGGGYLDVMQSISSYFCKNAKDDEPIVAVADYGNKREVYRAEDNLYGKYFSADSKIYVLADGDTASASECLIGCMLDYGAISYENICLSERSGVCKTFGKGIMQETYYVSLMEKDALKLTTAEIRWPVSDTSIHGRGILAEDGTKTVSEGDGFETETVSAIAVLLGAGTN